MPNNIFQNVPIAVTAIQTADFAEIGLNSSNILVIHKIGTPPASWMPSRSINPIESFETGQGYVIYATQSMDLSTYVIPPVPSDLEEIQNWVISNFAELSHTHSISDIVNLQASLDAKQPVLVSGTNIKTINGQSLVGSGNLTLSTNLFNRTSSGIVPASGGTNGITNYLREDGSWTSPLSGFSANGVIYAGSDGVMKTNAAFTYDGTTMIVGANDPNIESGFALNGGRGTLSADIAGFYLRVGSGTTGVADTSKKFHFFNKGTEYLQIGSSTTSAHYASFLAGVTLSVSSLGGSGTRMVVADTTGVLSTQTIPSYSTVAASGSYNDLTNKPVTSFSGSGIVVATGGALNTVTYLTDNSTNWDSAYGWGNHAAAGYLTAITLGGSSSSIQFNDGSALAGSSNFVWDATNNRLGIGTSTPLKAMHISGDGAFGDSVTSLNATRALNLISTNAVMNITRISSSINTASPAIELIHRTTADGTNNSWWDAFLSSAGFVFRHRHTVAGNVSVMTLESGAPANSLVVKADGTLKLGAITSSVLKLDANSILTAAVAGTDFETPTNKSTSTTLSGASASNTKYPSELAVKTYVDNTFNNNGIYFDNATTKGAGTSASPIYVDTTALSLFSSTAKGIVPASGGGTTNFLRADGTWAAPPTGTGGSSTLAGLTDIALTSIADQQLLKYDTASSKWINFTHGFASLSATQTFSGTNTFSGASVLLGGIQTTATASSSNFRTPGGTNSAGTTATGNLILGATSLEYRANVCGLGSTIGASTRGYAGLIIAATDATEAASGSHPFVGSLVVRPVNLIDNATATTTNGATVYIEGATTGTATVTNNYALWVDSGDVRLDGNVILTTSPTTSASTYDIITRNTTTGVLEKIASSSISATTSLSALTDVTLTSLADQQLLKYDNASSKWINFTHGFASLSGTQTFSGTNTFSSAIVVTGGYQSHATSTSAIVRFAGSNNRINTSVSAFQVLSSSTTSVAALLGTSDAYTLSAGNSYFTQVMSGHTVVEASSGTHGTIGQLALKSLVVTDGTATTTNGATLYIEGAPTWSANAASKNYALWVDDGLSRMDGRLLLGVNGVDTGDYLYVGGSASITGNASFGGQFNGPFLQIIAGATPTVSWNDGNIQAIQMTVNITSLTLSNQVQGGKYQLMFYQDATGGRTITWPASFKWAGGATPALTTTANKVDIVTLVYDGAFYYASMAPNF